MQAHVPAHRPHGSHRPALGLAAGVVVVLAGGTLAATDVTVGVAIACAGLLMAVWYVGVLDDERTLANLAGVALGDMAVPLPVLPAASAHPHRDVALLSDDLPAVVALPAGGWGLVPRDSARAALGRAGFGGRWHRIARPVDVWDPDVALPDIGRIPRDADAVLVSNPAGAPLGVTGAAMRARATAVARAQELSR